MRLKFKMITVRGLECYRCGHQWVPIKTAVQMCPRCKSRYFHTPRPVKKTA